MLDEIKMDDLNKMMDPADRDDYDPDFKEQPMIVQVGKVLDSRGNPNPITTVTTDDGKKHDIDGHQASTIKMLLTTDKVMPQTKRQFTMDVQKSETLEKLLQHKKPEDMINAFLQMYKPQGREKSNY